jgi:hypothetical protein
MPENEITTMAAETATGHTINHLHSDDRRPRCLLGHRDTRTMGDMTNRLHRGIIATSRSRLFRLVRLQVVGAAIGLDLVLGYQRDHREERDRGAGIDSRDT